MVMVIRRNEMDTSKKSVLVIDDSEMALKLYKTILRIREV